MPNSIIGSPIEKNYSITIHPPVGSPPSKGPAETSSWTIKSLVPLGSDFVVPSTERQTWLTKSPSLPTWNSARKSGLIIMKPYSRGNITTSYSIAKVRNGSSRFYYLSGYYYQPDNGYLSSDYELVDQNLIWTEQGSFDYWKNVKQVPHYSASVDYENELQQVKTSLVTKLNTSYDLLTELVEGKESIRTIADLLTALSNPLAAFKRERDRLYKSFHSGEIKTYSRLMQRVADAWMTYRYGIMPIIYSIQDIMKTLKLSDKLFHTERARSVVSGSEFNPTIILPPKIYLEDKVSGSVDIRAIGKDGYEAGTSVQVADLIGFNPITTAWEKIPYSFVIDWALNVSDYLNGVTSSLTSLASQRVMCYSVRNTLTVDTVLNFERNFTKVYNLPERRTEDRKKLICPAASATHGMLDKGSAIVKSVRFDTYSRAVFTTDDLRISWSLSMNWKRILDSLSLSLTQARNRISRIR